MTITRFLIRLTSNWANRHLKDPYVRASSFENYRARSAYKLLQIDDKYSLISPGISILDIGAAPGSWTQVCIQRLKDFQSGRSLVVAVDRDSMEPIDGVHFIRGDFTRQFTQLKIKELLHERKGFNLILSDMLPNMTGVGFADKQASLNLCEMVVGFALSSGNLDRHGCLLMKILQSGGELELKKRLDGYFEKVLIVKPAASRKESKEVYLLAINKTRNGK